MIRIARRFTFALLFLTTSTNAFAQDGYQTPPKVVMDILDAPAFPQVQISSDRSRMLIIERANMPTIADLAQPMLRLAGSRINPNTFGPHGGARTTGILIRDLASGK